MDKGTPSFNTISKCSRLFLRQNEWYYLKETEQSASNTSLRFSQ